MWIKPLDDTCRIAHRDAVIRDVFSYHTAGTDKAVFPNVYTGQYNHVGPDNGMFSDMDGEVVMPCSMMFLVMSR